MFDKKGKNWLLLIRKIIDFSDPDCLIIVNTLALLSHLGLDLENSGFSPEVKSEICSAISA